MASQIDPTKPEDNVPAVKAELRANLQATKNEIEALQSGKADAAHTHPAADSAVSASRALVLTDALDHMLRVDSPDPVTLTVPSDASATFATGAVINIVRWGTGELIVAADDGITLHKPTDRSARARNRFSVVALWKQAPDVWLLYGDLA